METWVLQTKDRTESKKLKELLHKMNISAKKLSVSEQEDFVFGNLLKEAVKKGEAKAESIDQLIDKWK